MENNKKIKSEKILGKINLSTLKNSVRIIDGERCLIIPIDSNNLSRESSKIVLNFIGFPIKKPSKKFNSSHTLKQYLQGNGNGNTPILGSICPSLDYPTDDCTNPTPTPSLFPPIRRTAPARQKSKNKPAPARPTPAKKARNVIPPPLHEVEKYCRERRNSVDPEAFIDFYQSKGWMVGSNKMKDWQAAIRTWEKRDAKDSLKGMKPFIIDDGIKYVLGPDGQYYHGRTGSLYIR